MKKTNTKPKDQKNKPQKPPKKCDICGKDLVGKVGITYHYVEHCGKRYYCVDCVEKMRNNKL